MQPLVVILAGGRGTRFAPFVTNKTLWPLMGKPVLEHTLGMVQAAGLTNVLVVANAENESFLKQYQTVSSNLRYRLQNSPLGMDDALKSIKNDISTQPTIVLNSIDFIDPTVLTHVMHIIDTKNPELIVAGLKSDSYIPATGYYRLDTDAVVGVVEKPAEGMQPSNVVRLVCDYFKHPQELIALFDAFANTAEKDARYEHAQNTLLQKYPAPLVYTSYWSKLKFPHSVLDVCNIALTHRIQAYTDPTAHIDMGAHIEGDVYIDAHASIESGVVIKGPCYIGRHARIGAHTLVRQSIIEEYVTIGFGSEVARSYIGPACQLHHSFVGDSVLEKDINMSWGTVTANLRIDGKAIRYTLPNGTLVQTNRTKLGALIAKGCFLSVNVSTMPGRLIEANTRILPQTGEAHAQ